MHVRSYHQTSIPSRFVPSFGRRKYTSVPHPSKETSSKEPPKYLANILHMARPIPSLGWLPTPALSSGSFFKGAPPSRCLHSSFHRPTSSSTVARAPVGLTLADRRGPKLSCSSRDALRTCEKENRSDGERICGLKRPPPGPVNESMVG